jgi:hypothetical protein
MVVLRGGRLWTFLEPLGDRGGRDAKGPLEPPQTAALLIGTQNLFALGLRK